MLIQTAGGKVENMKEMILDSERFEVVNPSTKQGFNIRYTCNSAYMWLKRFEDLYKRPSQAKQDIYNYWHNWLYMMDGVVLGCSGNCNMFTIYGQVTLNNVLHFVQITKQHNRIVVYG